MLSGGFRMIPGSRRRGGSFPVTGIRRQSFRILPGRRAGACRVCFRRILLRFRQVFPGRFFTGVAGRHFRCRVIRSFLSGIVAGSRFFSLYFSLFFSSFVHCFLLRRAVCSIGGSPGFSCCFRHAGSSLLVCLFSWDGFFRDRSFGGLCLQGLPCTLRFRTCSLYRGFRICLRMGRHGGKRNCGECQDTGEQNAHDPVLPHNPTSFCTFLFS